MQKREEPMIERLQQVLTRIEQLPPEVQEEVAAQLEALTDPFIEIPDTKTHRSREKSKSFAGAWRDLDCDDGHLVCGAPNAVAYCNQ